MIGLVLNGDGFACAHEIFDGNRTDTTTVSDMLDALDRREKDGVLGIPCDVMRPIKTWARA